LLDLRNNDTYIHSCVKTAEERTRGFATLKDVEEHQPELNAYPRLDQLEAPHDVIILDSPTEQALERSVRSVLEGRLFAEHAAAGEATRLGLGAKYLLNIANDLSADRIAELMSEEKGRRITSDDVVREAGCRPEDLDKIALGPRHMLQYSFDIARLALKYGVDPAQALARQRMIVILSESTADQILDEFRRCRFWGFDMEKMLFMVQRSYHGIRKDRASCVYDPASPKRLHNHGQMVMQQTLDNEIFRLSPDGSRQYLSADEFRDILAKMDDKISYNIEDLGFLLESIDFMSLAAALSLGDQGYRMMMEIVANNPDNPQKGGMAAFDKGLGRNVMIEGFQLKGIQNKDITYLNKNFNHYMKPNECWEVLRKHGLYMPLDVKRGFIYFQPVQGDINFLVKTAFVQRKVLKPIQSWKSPGTTPLTMMYLKQQDGQPGFLDYARRFVQS
jgi:hypothetical protein